MSTREIINPYATYYLHEIARKGWLGSTSPFVCRRLITEFREVLNPKFIGTGRSTRIFVAGKDIQEFQRRDMIVRKRHDP